MGHFWMEINSQGFESPQPSKCSRYRWFEVVEPPAKLVGLLSGNVLLGEDHLTHLIGQPGAGAQVESKQMLRLNRNRCPDRTGIRIAVFQRTRSARALGRFAPLQRRARRDGDCCTGEGLRQAPWNNARGDFIKPQHPQKASAYLIPQAAVSVAMHSSFNERAARAGCRLFTRRSCLLQRIRQETPARRAASPHEVPCGSTAPGCQTGSA